jgi:hypothetical protein
VGNTYKQVAGNKGLEGVSGDRKPDVVGYPLIALDRVSVPRLRVQPIWFTFKIPKHSKPGVYHGVISIQSDQYKVLKLNVNMKVRDYTIPDPKNYSFKLDIFMNPFSVADYYNVKPWSKAHWKLLGSYFDDLASVGQKKILATIIEKPWKVSWLNGKWRPQTYIGYHSMIKWRLLKSGQWDFDYSIFDQYVQTALKHGIGPYISAVSMLTFRGRQRITYYDEQKDKKVVEKLHVDDKRYKKVWSTFLNDFSTHLKKKGWLDQTYIVFDERPPELMNKIMVIIKRSAPEFKDKIYVSGASKADMFKYAADLNVSYNVLLEKKGASMKKAIKKRINKGRPIRFYQTCCSAPHPNRYSYSPAVESYMIPWITLKYNLSGYADWAYNSWPKDVFKFPVFRYTQGDEYWVYPGKSGPISSIRWELLKEGIEDYELVRVLQGAGCLKEKNKDRAIELATKNPNGQEKDVQDIIKARQSLLNSCQ